MLSVVALVCVAMFDGRVGPTGSQDASLVALVTSSPRSVYQQMQQPETTTPLSLLPAPPLTVATPTLHLPATMPPPQQQGRRRLLDWDSSPAELDSLGELIDVSGHNATGSDLLSTLSRTKQGLWRYSHRVATLYPRLTADMLRNQSRASNVGGGQPKRNLRSRRSTTHPAAPPSVVAAPASAAPPALATSKGLVSASAAQRGRADLPLLASHYVSEPVPPVVPLARIATVNRVLMTTGKALLDPALTVTVPDNEVPLKHQPHTSSPASSALSAWRGPPVPVPVPVPEADQAGGAKPVVFSPAADSQVLVMLLPASSIRWGKAWADSAEGTTEALLNTFNNGTDTPNGAGGPDEAGQMWVEIGCSVFKIQVVKNVTMA